MMYQLLPAIWRWVLDMDNGSLNRVLLGLHLVDAPPGWLTSTSLALTACILVNIWIGIPFNTAILFGGLQDIPEELYEAASADGATALSSDEDDEPELGGERRASGSRQ